jgi:hypothetical protein
VGVQIRTRGQTLWYSRYRCTLCLYLLQRKKTILLLVPRLVLLFCICVLFCLDLVDRSPGRDPANLPSSTGRIFGGRPRRPVPGPAAHGEPGTGRLVLPRLPLRIGDTAAGRQPRADADRMQPCDWSAVGGAHGRQSGVCSAARAEKAAAF